MKLFLFVVAFMTLALGVKAEGQLLRGSNDLEGAYMAELKEAFDTNKDMVRFFHDHKLS